MAKAYPKVLILGVVPSLTWAVARCIRRAGGRPFVMGWHRYSAMAFSGDCARYLPWKGIYKEGEHLAPSALEQVRACCQEHAIDVVIGADYDTALLLARCQDDPAVPACATPRAATISTFNDKWNLTRLMQHLQLPVPDSERVDSAQALLATALTFPIITKPLGLWASVGFQIHASRAALEQTLARGKLEADFPLIAQRHVPGRDAGASFLARDGQIAAYSTFFHHQRGHRQFHGEPRLKRYLATFAEATAYHGVGHIDLRYDPSRDEYRILELNPRFWASLLYAANAGVNYPDLLVRLAQWDGRAVSTAGCREVALPPYERMMSLASRWVGAGYEKMTGAYL